MENALYAREQEATRLRGELSALQDGNRQAQLHRAVLESRIRQLEEDKARLDEFWANSLGSAGSVELQQREAYENIQKIQMLTVRDLSSPSRAEPSSPPGGKPPTPLILDGNQKPLGGGPQMLGSDLLILRSDLNHPEVGPHSP